MTATTAPQVPAELRAKIAARILRHLTGEATVKTATRSAAWEALTEARDKGWSEDARAYLVELFAMIGAEILSDALADMRATGA